eukprot:GILJ01002019.1.p1 GENE.GILJ01002019.1~~GILJ01002019.1.p1  ORF type:complete len:370 (-),score=49.89 GILJ01002019.1:251-1360(-)
MSTKKELGNKAFAAGDYAEALRQYTSAIAEDENNAILYSNRAAANLKLGHFQDALNDAKKCTELSPTTPKGYFRLGEALRLLNRPQEALSAYKQAILHGLPQDEYCIKKMKEVECLVDEHSSNIVFRQLSPGEDYCVSTQDSVLQMVFSFAKQMANFVYVVGDASAREVLLVDPAWDIQGLLKYAEAMHLTVVGAIVTHYHFDHAGGLPPPPYDAFGIILQGVMELVRDIPTAKIYVHEADADTVIKQCKVSASSIVKTTDNMIIHIGSVPFKFIHTPGHTPGSQCVLVGDGKLLTGDTLFIGSCGRLDLPDCSTPAMYTSLQKLSSLPDTVRVYPGHNYGGTSTSIAKEKQSGLLRPMSESEWRARFG